MPYYCIYLFIFVFFSIANKRIDNSINFYTNHCSFSGDDFQICCLICRLTLALSQSALSIDTSRCHVSVRNFTIHYLHVHCFSECRHFMKDLYYLQFKCTPGKRQID